MTTAIVQANSSALAQAEWTRERVELVKTTICPTGISDGEFALFIEQCKRSGLDPLLKEAFCVPRRANVGNRERPQWVTRHEFQPSETGMLARAERFPDFLGVQASAVYADDEISIDQGKGEVSHRFNPTRRKGAIVGAWARVVRREKVATLIWLDFAGYAQPTPLWAKIPATMLEKCARVAALRKAYPEAFGGLYIREELPEAEDAPTVDVTPSPAPPEPQRPQLSAGAKRKAAAAAAAVGGEVLDVQPEPLPIPLAFGSKKGTPICLLSESELSEAIDTAHHKLAESPDARWAPAMRTNLSALEDEVSRRVGTRPASANGHAHE